jgi:hypothetical protein
MIGRADPRILDRLRLIYNFSGFPIVGYRRRETFPIRDPVFERYLKLRALTPMRFRFSAPEICGEAGWRLDGGLVNVDVALAQERVQFMYFSGVLDWLDEKDRPVAVMEIGAGCGLMALALLRAFPESLYAICDVPEVLAVSFAYLNLALPDRRHFVVLPSGIWDVAAHANVDISDLKSGVVYIPNYMMHKYGEHLRFDMTVNAMSLHEMRQAQIAYYCNFMARSVDSRDGVYFDINAHRGHVNKANDNFLQSAFSCRQDANLTDLSLGARIWSNSRKTMNDLKRRAASYRDQYDLDSAFLVEHPYEIPPFNADAAYQALNEDLGGLIGIDFESWMKQRRYNFADPIAGYRNRHHFP